MELDHPVRGKIKSTGCPVNFHGVTHPNPLKPPPILGEHCEEILARLGYPDEDIKKYNTEGVINIPLPEMFERKEIKFTGPEVTPKGKGAAMRKAQLNEEKGKNK